MIAKGSKVGPRRIIRRTPVVEHDLRLPAPVYAVGALSGGLDPLARLLDRIAEDAAQSEGPQSTVVFLGNLFDPRDPLHTLRALAKAEATSDGGIVALLGPRERALLGFLDHPPVCGPEWLAQGGRSVLSALGISLAADITPAVLRRAAGQVARALGRDLVAWLSQRPETWASGNLTARFSGRTGVDPAQSWLVHAQPGSVGAVQPGNRIAVGGGHEAQRVISAVRLAQAEPPRFVFSDETAMRAAS